MNYEFRYVQNHIEVYSEDGSFLFSADNQHEAMDELRAMDAA